VRGLAEGLEDYQDHLDDWNVINLAMRLNKLPDEIREMNSYDFAKIIMLMTEQSKYEKEQRKKNRNRG
jgi:hypothetical protein